MDIDFIKVDPAQNMTVLVKSHHERALYKDISKKLMQYNNVYAEQVGFIEPAEKAGAWARLHMMGGEFCGNAAASLAVVAARDRGLKEGLTHSIPLEVSGAEDIVNCEVTMNGRLCICKIEMPTPTVDGEIIRFPGIAHVIVNAREVPPDDDLIIGKMIESLLHEVKEEALGLMIFDEEKQFLTPVVYVKDIGVPIRERSCASGAAAIGARAAYRAHGDIELSVNQPGGVITVIAKESADRIRIWIKTNIRIAAEGTAFISV